MFKSEETQIKSYKIFSPALKILKGTLEIFSPKVRKATTKKVIAHGKMDSSHHMTMTLTVTDPTVLLLSKDKIHER